MDAIQSRAKISGYLNSSPQSKQRLGRSYAVKLGLQPGNAGNDGGIDGIGYLHDGRKIYFQSKLESKPLGKGYAKQFCDKIDEINANIAVILAGVGYTKDFLDFIAQDSRMKNVKFHCLILADIINQTEAYQLAQKDLPTVTNLNILDQEV
jgi:hypothetical protein